MSEAHPHTLDALFHQGLELLRSGQNAEAAAVLRRLLALDPTLAEAWHNLGHACRQDNPADAEHALRTARRLAPGNDDIACTLAELYRDQGRLEEGRALYEQVLQRHPREIRALTGAGHACQNLFRGEEAQRYYEELLRIVPDDGDALNNLGVLLREKGELDASRHCFETILSRTPQEGDAHWNLSHTLLLSGQLEQGWREYEWRFNRSASLPLPSMAMPRWQGEPLPRKSILIWTEQAYGDTFQFVRYAAVLANQGARVILAAQDRQTASLLEGCSGVQQVVLRDQPLPSADYWIPLLSLPLVLGTTLESIPTPLPYLQAPVERLEAWQQHIPPTTTTLKVGLVWAGRQRPDPRRSCPAQELLPLGSIKDCSWYSLQVGAPTADLERLSGPLQLTDLAPRLTDFSETAAAISALDLVITIDTSVAHLASSLGVPTWVLLPFAPDWRWLLQRSDSPWYPSARLFRQPQAGEWGPVIGQVRQALETCLARGMTDAAETPQESLLLDRVEQAQSAEDWQAALNCCLSLLALDPLHPLALLRGGGSLLFLRQPRAARRLLERLILRQPEHVEAHINLALACLTCGDYPSGWREFQWRLAKLEAPLPPLPLLPAPGVSLDDLHGASLLVHTEQGFGDTLQFARYLPLLARRGIRTMLSVPASLQRLLEGLEGIERVVPHGELLPHADYQTFLLSLPLLLEQPEPAQEPPYLHAPGALIEQWGLRLPDTGRLRIGLAWSGRQMKQSGYRRSLSLNDLRPLLELPGAIFVSLQTGPAASHITELPEGLLLDCSDAIGDFADTAAIMANLDLVITIDTSVAHLAGAQGKPTWVALLHAPDWRWGLEGESTPWYPTMRLFRQPQPGAWPEVIRQLERELVKLLCQHLWQQASRRYQAHDFSTSLPLLEDLLRLAPDHQDARFCLAVCLLQRGRPGEAEALLRELLQAEPSPEAWNNLGYALGNQGRREEAVEAFRQATLLEPASAQSWQNLGNYLHSTGQGNQAQQALQQAASLSPDSPEIWQNLGLVHQGLGELVQAQDCFRRALNLRPGYAMASWNLGLLLLLRGNYREGFPLLEARFSKPGALAARHGDLPRWQGQPIAGQRLLLHAEQGYGDTIQFLRYVPLLARQGVLPVVEVQDPNLLSLAASVEGISQLFVRGDERPPVDLQLPLFSLGSVCSTTPDTIPPAPYLTSPTKLVEQWRVRLGRTSSPVRRIGLAWRGRATPDPGRSVPIQELTPLFELPGIEWYSLQVDDTAHQETPPAVRQEHTPFLTDFGQTAACLANLDLVITIDTALAHLTGALGVPGIVMLQAVPDWRWGMDQEISPWYPTLRLVRQSRQGEWREVIERIHLLLQ